MLMLLFGNLNREQEREKKNEQLFVMKEIS